VAGGVGFAVMRGGALVVRSMSYLLVRAFCRARMIVIENMVGARGQELNAANLRGVGLYGKWGLILFGQILAFPCVFEWHTSIRCWKFKESGVDVAFHK